MVIIVSPIESRSSEKIIQRLYVCKLGIENIDSFAFPYRVHFMNLCCKKLGRRS